MKSTKGIQDEHEWVISHLTDYLTERADPVAVERINRHLAGCSACAAEMQIERCVREHIRTPATVEYTPGASLAKLKVRLSQAPAASLAPRRRSIRRFAVPVSLAASLVALTVSLVGLMERRVPVEQAPFQTLSDAQQARFDLHLGFSSEATADEIERALAEVGGRIISGPSAAGLYRITIGDAITVDSAIETLSRRQSVRLVVPAPRAKND
jgi:anti-sigma factor RsiW